MNYYTTIKKRVQRLDYPQYSMDLYYRVPFWKYWLFKLLYKEYRRSEHYKLSWDLKGNLVKPEIL